MCICRKGMIICPLKICQSLQISRPPTLRKAFVQKLKFHSMPLPFDMVAIFCHAEKKKLEANTGHIVLQWCQYARLSVTTRKDYVWGMWKKRGERCFHCLTNRVQCQGSKLFSRLSLLCTLTCKQIDHSAEADFKCEVWPLEAPATLWSVAFINST